MSSRQGYEDHGAETAAQFPRINTPRPRKVPHTPTPERQERMNKALDAVWARLAEKKAHDDENEKKTQKPATDEDKPPAAAPPKANSTQILTLGIETSCDDTSVALLQYDTATRGSNLLFLESETANMATFSGVHPAVATLSHGKHLARLTKRALASLPLCSQEEQKTLPAHKTIRIGQNVFLKPDFISVTRGPGFSTSLAVGLNTAKGLCAAFDIPLVGVNHMQAHALTPRLVSSLTTTSALTNPSPVSRFAFPKTKNDHTPAFPYMSLLLSGRHNLFLRSDSLKHHEAMTTSDLVGSQGNMDTAHQTIGVGNALAKAARMILPPRLIQSATDTNYAALLEEFAWPGSTTSPTFRPSDYKFTGTTRKQDREPVNGPLSAGRWVLAQPLADKAEKGQLRFDLSGLSGHVQQILVRFPDMPDEERRELARAVFQVAFTHIASRVCLTLSERYGHMEGFGRMRKIVHRGYPTTLVISGGVAANKFLLHCISAVLKTRGFTDINIVVPPKNLCGDNAAMIAWTGVEMWLDGWETDLGVAVERGWAVQDNVADDAETPLMGLDGWIKRDSSIP